MIYSSLYWGDRVYENVNVSHELNNWYEIYILNLEMSLRRKDGTSK